MQPFSDNLQHFGTYRLLWPHLMPVCIDEQLKALLTTGVRRSTISTAQSLRADPISVID